MDTVTNEPKPEDEPADDLTLDLDAAIRELDRFRRPEAWAAPEAGRLADAEDAPPAEAEAGVAGPADRAPLAVPMAPIVAAGTAGAPDRGLDADDNDDELFAPEPAAAAETAFAERRWRDRAAVAPDPPPAAESDYGAVFVMPPAPDDDRPAAAAAHAGYAPGDFDTAAEPEFASAEDESYRPAIAYHPPPVEEPVAEPEEQPSAAAGLIAPEALSPQEDRPAVVEAAADTGTDVAPGDADSAAEPAFAPAEEPHPATAPDADSGTPEPEAFTGDPAPVAEVRLPSAANLPPYGAAMVPAPAADTELPDLPRRMFGLKRALDAHRLGVSIDELPGGPDVKPVMEQTAVTKSDVIEPTPATPEPQDERSGWYGAWRAAKPAADIGEPAAAVAPQPEALPERKGWFGSRRAVEPEAKIEPTAGPVVATAAAAAVAGAAAAEKAERKGWFGSRKTPEPEAKTVEPAPVPAAPAVTPAEPAPKTERAGWFGLRRKPQTAAETVAPEPEGPAAEAPAPAAPETAASKPDPFAAMTAAIGPKAKGERKGWFGSRRAPEPEPEPGPDAAPPKMVDLAPLREAMQAAAQQRTEVSAADIAMLAAGLSGETPAAQAADAARIGVLLVNLGTPEAPTAKAVRTYLREFLSDPRVIEKDTFLWQLVLRGIILPFRPRSKARAYQTIWNKEKNESPLKTVTRSQAQKLGEALAEAGGDTVVDWAMRYGNPSIEARMKALMAQGCARILLVPLYPQYSSATTATVCDEAFRVLTRIRNQPSLRVAPPYYADPIYVEALASSIRAALAGLSFKPDVILASYHGMPLDYVQKGDPYQRHCARTTDLLRERLGMSEANFMMTFQSRFGRAEWLEPYTDVTLRKLAKDGVRNVAVVTPGFAADCLETLEEIAIENAHIFKKKGGKNFAFIPCLNDSERGMLVLREIAARELKGWV